MTLSRVIHREKIAAGLRKARFKLILMNKTETAGNKDVGKLIVLSSCLRLLLAFGYRTGFGLFVRITVRNNSKISTKEFLLVVSISDR